MSKLDSTLSSSDSFSEPLDIARTRPEECDLEMGVAATTMWEE